ncbi:acyltransferase family protein [Sphingobium sp. KCTC 72723]|uniref:acyltransferase family protein n=1 Tax=Sphingobium sp. KCTC 72723 TaxID=2733867 RepID=UPI00165D9202|nr:acyltransferase family protein [Sphingobium sp. KCTC 72723]
MGKNPSVDLLKGVLILLVMIGHCMEITHYQHPALWVGAGFRMPLMIGISGYLLNLIRLRAAGMQRIFGHYGERMLLPWLVAMLVYMLISGWPLGWSMALDMLLRPPFHLWYIPVLFFLVLIARLVPLPPIVLLAIGTPFSLSIMASFGLDHGPIAPSLLAPDSRFLRYPVYFFFGMLMAERGISRRYLGAALLAGGLGMAWWIGLGTGSNSMTLMAARLLMCLGFIALLPLLSLVRVRVPPLNAIGRDSLFFYLWHPLAMALLMAGGAGAGMMLALSVPGLFIASRLSARLPTLGRLLGSMPERRATATLPDAVPQAA